jgi:peptidylprolyl isomerase
MLKLISKFLKTLFLSVFAGVTMTVPNTHAADMANTVYLDLKDGRVVIELLPKVAPNTTTRIKQLVKKGFYDNIVFHRVIDGFMAQTGDPTGTGTSGSGAQLRAEFSKEPHLRGTLSMARAADVDSADSQFFIVLKDSNFLDGQYTVFGRVISGMEFVDKIKKGSSITDGAVTNPDKIVRMSLGEDDKIASSQNL